MAVSMLAVFPFWITLLLGGGAGLPLSLPPLPEDPMLVRVAPAECLVYTSWSGMAVADAKSTNQTEQLLAEPEVRDMFAQIERAITSGIERNGPPQQCGCLGRCPLGQEGVNAADDGLCEFRRDRAARAGLPRRSGAQCRRRCG